MTLSIPLFEGRRICLGPIDHEKEAEIQSRWTHDIETMRMLSFDPVRPASPAQIKKRLEAIEKKQVEEKNQFYLTIRLREDDRLLGFARLYWIEWTNGSGFIELLIGDVKDRRQGYGREALELLLRYAFAELNLYRLTALIAEYNLAALGLFSQGGFLPEVRRRQALHRGGQRWDALHLGLLASEWSSMKRTA